MLVTVLALGLFAGWRNATACALVVAYFAVMIPYWRWGVAFPASVGFLFDATVLAIIYCKAPAFDCWPYRSPNDQLFALWFERSYWDRFVIAAFGAAWVTYFAPIPDAARWWPMWTIAMAQYFAAGGETLQALLSTRTAKRASPPDPPGFMYSPGRDLAGYE